VKRLEAAAQALGVRATVEVVLYQLVSFLRAGQPAKMSRRAGDFISLDELLDEVGSDAARYTLLTRSSDSPLDFDIELVTRQSMDNPVYYVQYAHARVASLLRMALQEGIVPLSPDDVPIGRLVEDGELELVRKLTEFPEVVALAGEILAPHRLTRYAEEVAAAFHRFYSECRVITEDRALTEARLALATAAKTVVATALSMLGVSAPESMERVDGAQEGDRVGRDVV
jgi:arginyl-tRNA synthetase